MSFFEKAYNEVAAIVREFEEHRGEFLASNYQESEVRTDFIDKFFTALGWDVAHREQTNPREREVKIEKSDTAGSTRRVDYAFYLKPDYRTPVFFCEAKKPSRDLNNTDDYFQLVRYGYGASTPIGALTNFDEFHIIDCRYQPHIEKSYPSAQIKVFGYKEYLDKEAFGYIYWIFSREAVEAGKLKDFAKSLPKQQGKGKAKLTAEEAKPVDEAFLTKLEEYRRILAKAFKKADENLNAEVLTEATQKVIDRLVFIRFLEDKYIETDYIVDQIAAKKGGAWKSFINWSKELDVKYNGVVFKPHDIDKPEWKAPDDKVFAELCADISHTHSKYLFTYIPIELLGSIYERFLGKVVTTTAKRAEIEDKPEVRKAGGVYYTPKYIVDYIVSNTVGKILRSGAVPAPPLNRSGAVPAPTRSDARSGEGEEAREGWGTQPLQLKGGLSPKEISKLRFADIACGSGSFLIAVYDTVLHHVEKWYNDNPAEAKKAKCTEIEKGIFVLSLKQKQQILLDNIFGVDIDRQAVEVAQLSLFLKLLESESGATAEQLSFERTKILPDLSKNIQCGNSLVEYDILDQASLFQTGTGDREPGSAKRSSRIPVPGTRAPSSLTDEEEKRIKPFSFQSAFREIMANGGFDAIVGNPPYGAELSDAVYRYAKKYFDIGNTDTAALFMIRASKLVKDGGLIGYIIPKSFTYASNWDKTRNLVISDLVGIVDCSKVWKDVKYEMSIYLSCKNVNSNAFDSSIRNGEVMVPVGTVDKKLCDSFGFILNGITIAETGVGSKMRVMSKNLNDFVTNRRGGMLQSSIQEMGDYFALGGKEIGRYEFRPLENKKIPSGEIDIAAGFVEPDSILVQNIVAHVMNPFPHIVIISTPSKHLGDNARFVILDTVNQLRNISNYSSNFLNAILNSNLISWYVYKFIFANAIRTMHFDSPITSRIPFPEINLSTSAVRKNHDYISALVDQMLDAKKRLTSATSGTERERHQKKCEYLDGEIDRLVYELYGLTAEEIKIVEG